MFKCNNCEKEFENKIKLRGHSKVHSKKYIENLEINSKNQSELQLKKGIENYYKNPKICMYCNNVIQYENRGDMGKEGKRFCNSSCSAKYNNNIRTENGFKMSEEQKKKISNTLKTRNGNVLTNTVKISKLKIVHPRKCNLCLILLKKKYVKKEHTSECKICGLLIINKISNSRRTYKKTCSLKCRNELISKNRSEYLLKNGTSNSWTKRYIFEYKGININCDSKLEQASLIYLKDLYGIEFYERFKSILNFTDEDGNTRRYNPDFITKINGKTTVIEIKMIWKNKKETSYTKYFNLKVETLKKFCEERKYEYLILNVVDNLDFKKVYKQHLKDIKNSKFNITV